MTNKLVGYARVSTNEQDLGLQLDALRKAGCQEKFIFTDKVSGSKTERYGLENCLKILEPGDTLLVWRLDRLGRSMSHLVMLIEDLLKKKIAFKSICDGSIDTTTASGELVFNIFSSLAQFERRVIEERTRAGLAAARARGRKGGRKPINILDPKIQAAKRMHKDHGMKINEICKILQVSRATLYRYVALKTPNIAQEFV